MPRKSVWMSLALVALLAGGCAFWLVGGGLPRVRGGDLLVSSSAGGSAPSGTVGPQGPGLSPSETVGDRGDKPSGSEGAEDKGQWSVLVEIGTQRVYVRQGGKLLRTMVCSTGTEDKPTPRGKFRIQNRGEWFYSKKYQQGAKWWVSFHNWGEYLFHSVPMDEQGRIIEEELRRLGQPASHGCVRLSLEDARWFYDNVPAGAPVEIE